MKIKETVLFKFLNIWLLTSIFVQISAPTVYAFTDVSVKNNVEKELKNLIKVKQAFKAQDNSTRLKNENNTLKRPQISQKKLATKKLLGGPGQVESASFSLNTTGDMVNPFTGDFSYSIPLMDVEGYPIVLSYDANIGMEDEASWVGLGWSLNVGSISRQMRGVPDDFDGTDKVKNIHKIKPDDIVDGRKASLNSGFMYKANETTKISKGLDLTVGYGTYKSAYQGKGKTFDMNIGATFQIGKNSEDDDVQSMLGLRKGLGYSSDTKNGISASKSTTIYGSYADQSKMVQGGGFGVTYGSNYHSRTGVVNRSLNMNLGGKAEFDKLMISGLSPVVGASTTFTLGSFSYVPKYQISSTTEAKQLIFDASVSYKKSKTSKWGIVGGIETQTYHSNSTLIYTNADLKLIMNPAYGYLNSAKRALNTDQGEYPIMDFNRERDVPFSEEMKNLPFSMAMYDVFYANGLGLNNTFRAQRNDAGIYLDATHTSEFDSRTNNFIGGFQMESGQNKMKIGYTNTDTEGNGVSEKWGNGDALFVFGSDENVQFKSIGEMTPKQSNLKSVLGGDLPAYIELEADEVGKPVINRKTNLIHSNGSSVLTLAAINNENVRDKPATIYIPIYAGDPNAPFSKYYNALGVETFFNRVDVNHKTNHISAFKIVSTEGMNYHYDLPVYSLSEQNVQFSTNATNLNVVDGLVPYTNSENSINNSSGRANLYDKQVVPGYATSFLLTGMSTSDYKDITGDGFSTDDFGNYYKINHTKVFDQTTPYKWRFPYSENKAFFNQGLIASELDNSASYMYGEKEIWYTKSVESKNLIAVFKLLDRNDAKPVLNENGGMDVNKSLKRLHTITLYNRYDYTINGSNAKKLQTVEFEYDYSLCPNNPSTLVTNEGSGKLTLKKIRVFSGEKSEETALHPYEFAYSTSNPSHKNQSVDRWGTYKTGTTSKPIVYFPAADQDLQTANTNASNWKLTRVISPNGSELEVTYEADSYRYVQNKRAMEHISISGFTTPIELGYLLDQTTWNGANKMDNKLQHGITFNNYLSWLNSINLSTTTSAINNMLLSNSIDVLSNKNLVRQLNELPCNVLIFKLNNSYSDNGQDKAVFEEKMRKEYFTDHNNNLLKELFVKTFVKLNQSGKYESIPTFAQIDPEPDIAFFDSRPAIGLMPRNASGSYEYGYVILKTVISDEDDNQAIALSPIQKSAMQFARINLPDIIYDQTTGGFNNLSLDRKAYWSGDIYHEMAKVDMCEEIITTMPSEVRLFDHDNNKIGGNGRVKYISIRDKWNDMSTEESNQYTWSYDYLDVRTFSKGVAAFEPNVGGDENPFYEWDAYTEEAIKFPDESKFTVKPIGEILFPSPIIGYETMIIKMSGSNSSNSNGLGTNEQFFYTAKDFPTIQKSTVIQKKKADKWRYLIEEIDLYGLSQGHIVITNDFHGKPFKSETYDKLGVLQGRTTYYYKNLGEKVTMMDRDASIANYSVATEFDVAVDARYIENKTHTLSLGGVLTFPIPITPNIGISPVLSVKMRKFGFYSHVINKHVNYSAIVDHVVTEHLGSINTAKSSIYDKYSGGVLLSSLTDEFNDQLYSFSYPAHWYYTLMRSPLDVTMTTSGVFSGTASNYVYTSPSSLKNKLTVGDLIAVSNGTSTIQAYVIDVSGNTAKLINRNTNLSFTLSGSCTTNLLVSGRKNMLAGNMQTVVTKRNPLNVTGTQFTLPTTDIISASALTLKPRLNMLCNIPNNKLSQPIGAIINPFDFGLLNNLMLDNTYAPQLERSSVQQQGIRYNGTLINYFPFYSLNANNDWVKINELGHPNFDPIELKNWRPNDIITVTDEFGKPIESKDAINVSSSVLYGYNRLNKLVPVAEAVNALQNEIAYDSFDDYSYYSSTEMNSFTGHFDFNASVFPINNNVSISSTVRHSGLSSLAVSPSVSAKSERKVINNNSCLIPNSTIESSQFQVQECMCIRPFEPFQGKEYLVSLWVRGNAVNTQNSYTDCSVKVFFSIQNNPNNPNNPNVQTITLTPSGQMIDGWQRVEGTFTIPSTATNITVELKNLSTVAGNIAYFDDIRIHPVLAGMTTTVYNPENLLPVATHDGYNFTTFYNYDENLNLVRVRVETINGIQTVSEMEGSTIMKFKN